MYRRHVFAMSNRPQRWGKRAGGECPRIRSEVVVIRSEPIPTTSPTYSNRFGRKISANIPLQKKKLVGRRHWIGNEVETSEVLGVAEICTNKGRLSFEAAMLL